MNTIKSRSSFFLFVCSLVCAIAFSLTITVRTACRNKFLELPCQVQDPSGKQVWKYKELTRDKWQKLGDVFLNKKASLSANISRKFKGVTSVFFNGSLVISSFAQELSGIYACQSYNKGHSQHSVVKVIAVSCEKTVCEGDVAIIECDLLKYKNILLFHPSEVVWKQKRTTLVEIASNMNVTYRNPKYPNIQGGLQGSLRIEYASKAINGQRYTCVVSGEHGVTPKRHYVVIIVKKCNNTITAYQGKSIDLECPYNLPSLNTNTENTRLEWYNDSTKIATLVTKDHSIHLESSLVKINGTNGMLTLVSPGVFDGGTYRCKVFRETFLLAEHSVTLNVTQPFVKTDAEGVTKAKANKIRNTVHLVSFALFVVFVLPI